MNIVHIAWHLGRLAQLVEHLVYTEVVGSSNLSSPTTFFPLISYIYLARLYPSHLYYFKYILKGEVEMPRIILPEGYMPSDSEEYMNDLQLEYFRQKLLSWKEELLEESRATLKHMQEDNWNEPDLNDRASLETDTATELRTRDRYRKLIDKMDMALERIESKEYGFCEETGEEIGLKRLEARPVATLCIEAQERHESYERQHVDEDELQD